MAVVRALSKFTPRMQAYCVKALRARLMIWRGRVRVREGGQDGVERRGRGEFSRSWSRGLSLGEEEGGRGDNDGKEGEMMKGGEERRWVSSDRRDGRKGRKKGMERKWL